MTKQHEHPKKQSFDIMEHLRKPHGLAIIAIIIGIAGWAMWTFHVW